MRPASSTLRAATSTWPPRTPSAWSRPVLVNTSAVTSIRSAVSAPAEHDGAGRGVEEQVGRQQGQVLEPFQRGMEGAGERRSRGGAAVVKARPPRAGRHGWTPGLGKGGGLDETLRRLVVTEGRAAVKRKMRPRRRHGADAAQAMRVSLLHPGVIPVGR